MTSAMKMHLDQTLDEATHHIQGKYEIDVADYHRMVTHILGMADILRDGIAAKFPQRVTAKASRSKSANPSHRGPLTSPRSSPDLNVNGTSTSKAGDDRAAFVGLD